MWIKQQLKEILKLLVLHIKHFRRSTGFILEDFPRNADECEYLRENGYFPDMCLSLEVDEEVISKRLLHPRMECWRKRRAIVEKKRNAIRNDKNQKRVRNFSVEKLFSIFFRPAKIVFFFNFCFIFGFIFPTKLLIKSYFLIIFVW